MFRIDTSELVDLLKKELSEVQDLEIITLIGIESLNNNYNLKFNYKNKNWAFSIPSNTNDIDKFINYIKKEIDYEKANDQVPGEFIEYRLTIEKNFLNLNKKQIIKLEDPLTINNLLIKQEDNQVSASYILDAMYKRLKEGIEQLWGK